MGRLTDPQEDLSIDFASLDLLTSHNKLFHNPTYYYKHVASENFKKTFSLPTFIRIMKYERKLTEEEKFTFEQEFDKYNIGQMQQELHNIDIKLLPFEQRLAYRDLEGRLKALYNLPFKSIF